MNLARGLYTITLVVGIFMVFFPSVSSVAQDVGLCAGLDAITEPADANADSLAGRLGGTRSLFEERFGPATAEDSLFTTWEIEGCGSILADFEEGIVTDISIYPLDFDLEDKSGTWTIAAASVIASRLLPRDVQMDTPYRNISTVEHHECYSDALAANVPSSVYAFVDNNPSPGQCSAVYSLGEDDQVQNFTVPLQIEDPN